MAKNWIVEVEAVDEYAATIGPYIVVAESRGKAKYTAYKDYLDGYRLFSDWNYLAFGQFLTITRVKRWYGKTYLDLNYILRPKTNNLRGMEYLEET